MAEPGETRNWFLLAWFVAVAAPVACLVVAIVPTGSYCGDAPTVNVAGDYIDMITTNRFAFDVFLAIYMVLGRCWILFEIGAVGCTRLHWLGPACFATIIADAGFAAYRLGGDIVCHQDSRTGRTPVAMGIACAGRSDLMIVQLTILFATSTMLLIATATATRSDGPSPW